MAGDWIKMRADLQTHPKVFRISSALKADKLKTIGALHAVWCLFDVHSVDGELEGYSLDIIDSQISWAGFSQAMVDVNWLVETAVSVELPEFDTHNGQPAKRRAMEADRKRKERQSGKTSAPTADKKRTREEERREENNNRGRFTPPTLLEVLEYTETRPIQIDCEKFLNFYESKGWMIGKNKMKDWKASVRTWEKSSTPNDFQEFRGNGI